MNIKNEKNFDWIFSGKIRGILPYQPAYKYDEVLDPIKENPSMAGTFHNCDSRIHQVRLLKSLVIFFFFFD